MRKQLLTLITLFTIQSLPEAFAADVNVILAGEVRPGVYGQVEIGSSRPRVIYEQPVVMVREHRHRHAAPIYLHVPPGHARHWAKHCHYYHSCGRPVYFVKNNEYGHRYQRHEYAPRYYVTDTHREVYYDRRSRNTDRHHRHDRRDHH